MALSFPFTAAAFWDIIRPQSTDGLIPGRQDELASQASGGTIAKQLAPALWGGNFTLVPRPHQDAASICALIESVMDASGTFYAYDFRKRYPYADPTGSIVGASAVKLNSVPSATTISLKGLPTSGYIITRGDLISFTYSGGTKTALHRAAETIVANGSGVTGVFSVTPAVLAGAAVNDVVSLKKPQMLAQILPNTYKIGGDTLMTTIQFGIGQVIG